MKPIPIGTYKLGSENVRLELATAESGGYFKSCPEDGGTPIMGIGLRCGGWNQTVGVLLHEALELAYYRAGLRYGITPDWANDNGSYMFVMDHFQFSEASARAANFLAESLPELAKVWKKHKKKDHK